MRPEENYGSTALVGMWADFIDWEKRRKGEGGFLERVLGDCKDVFDACLGDGCDSIHLLKRGFSVTSNDLDPLFIEKAKENAKREKVTLRITSYDWRDLQVPDASFDAVICLGNSLTYLFEREDQLRALRQFRRILRPGGTLIIDERNYQSMLDDRERVLQGDFRYSGNYVYCGTIVHGRPVEIDDRQVTMEYTDDRTGETGRLILYPFRRGELLGLLQETGFTVMQYADYKEGAAPDADFYQYVARK